MFFERIRWEGSEFLLSCTVCFEVLRSGAEDGNVLQAISLQAKSSRVVIWPYFVRDKTSRSVETKLLYSKTNATFTRPTADSRSSKFSYTLLLRSFQAPTNSKSFNPGTLRSSMMLTAVRENLLASARCFGSRISTEFEIYAFLLPSALWYPAWDYIAMVRPARLLRILRFRVSLRRTLYCFPSWLLSSSLEFQVPSAIHVQNEWFGDLISFLLSSESSNAGAKHQGCSQTDHSKQLWQESEAPITIP